VRESARKNYFDQESHIFLNKLNKVCEHYDKHSNDVSHFHP